jgi:hypothetical protein
MSYGKHGRFDDTCQDKRQRMKKRHPCRFKVESLAIDEENAYQRTLEARFWDPSVIHIRQRPERLLIRRLAI